jgi:NADH-quinone oxidoreductase subunit L
MTVAAPLGAWLLIVLLTFVRRRRPGAAADRLAAALGIAAAVLSLALAVGVLGEALDGGTAEASRAWIRLAGESLSLNVGVDLVSAVMLVVVLLVSLSVQVYSLGYMRGDSHVPRFYANVSLFTFAMLLLLVARDYLLLLVAWELMGLCSYLLIGHYFTTAAAQKASLKAFLVTRLGDVGLFLAVMVLYATTGTLTFTEVFARLPGLSQGVATTAALGLLAAAAGKSAQFPLHVWLPDAMAGPTPASALIHAATMVAAGVYLVARSYPLFAASGTALTVAAYMGGVTAFFAALKALRAMDLKRVLAYSTISQLGYMMMALGTGGRGAALFHLMTHAFFKAMLFLAAGVVIHAAHTQDLRRLGGLWRELPGTALAFLLGGLALAGIPPLSGYFSKEEILVSVAGAHLPGLLAAALVTVALTGFYTSRVFCLTFLGAPAGGHAARTSLVMLGPLFVLALPTVLAGLAGSRWAGGHEAAEAAHWVGQAALLAAASGVLAGGVLYGPRAGARLRQGLLDALRTTLFTASAGWLGGAGGSLGERGGLPVLRTIAAFDRAVIDRFVDLLAAAVYRLAGQVSGGDRRWVDGAVNGFAAFVSGSGRRVGRLETGYLANYLLTFFLGLVACLAAAGALVWAG